MLVRLASAPDLPEVYALRHEVFVVGQAVPVELERDALDEVCLHAIARCLPERRAVGTGRLVPPGGAGATATIGRMAVAEGHRGQGIGAAVLALLEAAARERGWPQVELHAQLHAQGFYARLGWTPYGEVYREAGIEHVSMRKQLQ